MTINELKKFIDEQITRGNGDRHIIISNDDEGNGYHPLFYAFDDDPELIEDHGFRPGKDIFLG